MGHVTFEQFGQVHKVPFTGEPVFADNTWEQIIKACRNDNVPDTWAVGDQKAMTINGKDYMITIIGKHHDEYSDGSGKAPLTLQMQDLLSTKYGMNSYNTNAGGWDECVLRTGTDGAYDEVWYGMPDEVVNGISAVKKRASAGSKSTEIIESNDNLFLLAEVEVIGYVNNSAAGEGKQYAYYAAGNSRIKYFGSTKTAWWLRSPNTNDTSRFCRIDTSGEQVVYAASNKYGISFAFCF